MGVASPISQVYKLRASKANSIFESQQYFAHERIEEPFLKELSTT